MDASATGFDLLEAKLEEHGRGTVIFEAPASMSDTEREAWIAETFPDPSPRTLFICLNRFFDEGFTPRVIDDGRSGLHP